MRYRLTSLSLFLLFLGKFEAEIKQLEDRLGKMNYVEGTSERLANDQRQLRSVLAAIMDSMGTGTLPVEFPRSQYIFFFIVQRCCVAEIILYLEP